MIFNFFPAVSCINRAVDDIHISFNWRVLKEFFDSLYFLLKDILKYAFLALAAGQYGAIKVVQKIVPAKSAANLPQAAIISFALCESVALLGLVLFLLAGNSMVFYIFMMISLGFFYLFFPKYEQREQRINAGGSPLKSNREL